MCAQLQKQKIKMISEVISVYVKRRHLSEIDGVFVLLLVIDENNIRQRALLMIWMFGI